MRILRANAVANRCQSHSPVTLFGTEINELRPPSSKGSPGKNFCQGFDTTRHRPAGQADNVAYSPVIFSTGTRPTPPGSSSLCSSVDSEGPLKPSFPWSCRSFSRSPTAPGQCRRGFSASSTRLRCRGCDPQWMLLCCLWIWTFSSLSLHTVVGYRISTIGSIWRFSRFLFI